MKTVQLTSRQIIATVSLLLSIGLLIGTAQAKVKTVKVNCNEGESIGEALEKGDSRKPLVVVVEGMCNENLIVTRDDVRIEVGSVAEVTAADPNLDVIRVDGAQRVILKGLIVKGGRNGVTFFHGASGTVDHSTVQDNSRHGITIEGAHATVIYSTVSGNAATGILVARGGSGRLGLSNADAFAGNEITTNGAAGILVDTGGTAFIADSMISGNGTDPTTIFLRSGVGVFRASAKLSGNEIHNNASAGVLVGNGASVLIGSIEFGPPPTPDMITGNGFLDSARGGISAFLGGFVLVESTAITGNAGAGVFAFENSVVELRRSTISSNIAVDAFFNGGHGLNAFLRSTVRLRNASVVENNQGHGILLGTGSAIDFATADGEFSTVTGNTGLAVLCTGGESSFRGNTSLVVGVITCSPF